MRLSSHPCCRHYRASACRHSYIAFLSLRCPCQAQPSCTAAASSAAMPLYSGELLPRPALPSCARPLSRPGLQGQHPAEHGAGEGTARHWRGLLRRATTRARFSPSAVSDLCNLRDRWPLRPEWVGVGMGSASQLLGVVTLQNSFSVMS